MDDQLSPQADQGQLSGRLLPTNTGNPTLDSLHQKFNDLTPQEHQVLIDAGIHPFLQAKAPPASAATVAPAGAPALPKNNGPELPQPPTISSIPSAQATSPRSLLGTGSSPAKPTPFASGLATGPQPLSPRTQGYRDALDQQIASKAGIDKLPGWARIPLKILEGVGMATKIGQNALPFIPGTDPHHQAQIRGAEGNFDKSLAADTAASRQGLEGAQTAEANARAAGEPSQADLRSAQAERERAEAYAKMHPDEVLPKTPFEKWQKDNPNGKVEDWLKTEESTKEKPGHEGLERDSNGNVVGWIDSKGALQSMDDAPPAIKAIAAATKPKQEKPDQYGDFRTGYLKEHPNATAEEVEAAFAKSHATPREPVDRGQNFVDPATGKLVRVEPGQPVPQGAVTPTQLGTVNTPTTQMRTAGTRAEMAANEVPGVIGEINRLKDKLGPVMGRWNDFTQGKIGMDDPDFAGLKTDLTFLSSAVALAHAVGRLPDNLRKEFDNMINAPKQTPENLITVLNHVQKWMSDNASAMKGTSVGRGGGTSKDPAGIR